MGHVLSACLLLENQTERKGTAGAQAYQRLSFTQAQDQTGDKILKTSAHRGSNSRPTVYKTVAITGTAAGRDPLATELWARR